MGLRYRKGTFPHVCGCGRKYSEAAWLNLESAGQQTIPEDETGPGYVLEYRNCACRSTLAVEADEEGVEGGEGGDLGGEDAAQRGLVVKDHACLKDAVDGLGGFNSDANISSLKAANKFLKSKGVVEELVRAPEGYYYFIGGTAHEWYSPSVHAFNITFITYEMLWSDYVHLSNTPPSTVGVIDHSTLSPNGRVSKRAREAAIQKAADNLYDEEGNSLLAPRQAQPSEIEHLRRKAAELRELAARGMSVTKYTKEAARLEAEAVKLEEFETLKGFDGVPLPAGVVSVKKEKNDFGENAGYRVTLSNGVARLMVFSPAGSPGLAHWYDDQLASEEMTSNKHRFGGSDGFLGYNKTEALEALVKKFGSP